MPKVTVGHRLAAVVEAIDGVRLYVPPPFDTLPTFRNRPPMGVDLDPGEVHVHVSSSLLPVAVAEQLVPRLRAALAGSEWAEAEIHLHVDQLAGHPYGEG